MTSLRAATRVLILGGTLGLAACSDDFDWDLRSDSGLNTAEAARAAATADRPRPDDRGVISYPSYQVVVARRGDTVAGIAARLGLEPGELARVNALTPDTALNQGEVLALPRRVAEPSPATGAATTGPITPETVEVTTLAAAAIDRAEGSAAPAAAPAAAPRTSGTEPVRHRVARGETAFSIARTYGVSARALAEWNGLPADMAVREGQTLLIPVTLEDRAQAAASVPPVPEPPGAGSATPLPQAIPLTVLYEDDDLIVID
ncbi:MAG: LysM peptidoglycan-binding domain-containing protein, partial [Rhodobacterales bacterium]|nr:LysM peptidoglycan-binding domain-containing protein [Rhodobacterales bacterium]